MVNKPKSVENEQKKGRVKVGKLKLNKETVKDLTDSEKKQIKGGRGEFTISIIPTCLPTKDCPTKDCGPLTF